MDLIRTERFKRDFKRLDCATQDRALEALDRFLADPRHPSLHAKKMEGTDEIWEMRVSDRHRITCQHAKGAIILRRVGVHDILSRP